MTTGQPSQLGVARWLPVGEGDGAVWVVLREALAVGSEGRVEVVVEEIVRLAHVPVAVDDPGPASFAHGRNRTGTTPNGDFQVFERPVQEFGSVCEPTDQ